MVTSTNFVNKILCFHKTNHLSKTKTLTLDRKTINMESWRDNKREGAINEITRSEDYSNFFINFLLYIFMKFWSFYCGPGCAGYPTCSVPFVKFYQKSRENNCDRVFLFFHVIFCKILKNNLFTDNLQMNACDTYKVLPWPITYLKIIIDKNTNYSK